LPLPSLVEAAWILTRECMERVVAEPGSPFELLDFLKRVYWAADDVLPNKKYAGDGLDIAALYGLYWSYTEPNKNCYKGRVITDESERRAIIDELVRCEARGWLDRHPMLLEIIKDDSYSRNSTDNKYSYKNVYDDKSDYPSKIGIFLKDDIGEVINSVIIINYGFSSGLPGSWMTVGDILFVLVGNRLYRVKLPELTVLTSSVADYHDTYAIFKVDNRIVVHGEQEITCFDLDGNKLWSFTGEDIFVSVEGSNPIEIVDRYIKLVDFNNRKYLVDFDGKLISSKFSALRRKLSHLVRHH